MYHITGDAKLVAQWMHQLAEKGRYDVGSEVLAKIQAVFGGDWADDAVTKETIGKVFKEKKYVLDTHTAVASYVYRQWKEQNHPTAPAVIASTASPFKFARSVMSAIDAKYAGMEDFALIDELSRIAHVPVPKAVEEIRNAPVLHDKVIEIGEMPDAVKAFLKINR